MKKIFLMLALSLTTIFANAFITEKNLPTTPPPYGVYVLNSLSWPYAKFQATEDLIAQHYGYKNAAEASRACRKVMANCVDVVHHRRDSDPVAIEEIKKYGMKNWDDAVSHCITNLKGDSAPYCQVDPFLKLRSHAK